MPAKLALSGSKSGRSRSAKPGWGRTVRDAAGERADPPLRAGYQLGPA